MDKPVIPLKFVHLPEAEFAATYGKLTQAIAFGTEISEADFATAWLTFDRQLRQALAQEWDPRQPDYAVTDARDPCWHHCLALYSDRICRPRFLEVLLAVLNAQPQAAKWVFHCSCEPVADQSRKMPVGEFFIHDGTIYVPEDGNDYKFHFFAGRPEPDDPVEVEDEFPRRRPMGRRPGGPPARGSGSGPGRRGPPSGERRGPPGRGAPPPSRGPRGPAAS